MWACRSFTGHSGTPWPAFIVFIIRMYFTMSLLLCSRLLLLAKRSRCRRVVLDPESVRFELEARKLTYFDRHVGRLSARAGSCRDLSGDGVGAFGVSDVDDPIAQEKFLR